MTATYPLTLLYDANCPVCALEMDHLRERDTLERLVFVNIAEPGFDPNRYGASLADMNAEIHAVAPGGRLLRGVEVLRLAYSAVGLGWVTHATGWPVMRPLFDLGYRLFAKHRMRFSAVFGPTILAVRQRRAKSRARDMARRMRRCTDRCPMSSRNDAHTTPTQQVEETS
jgi:predicted DCC family thiol-disulfide oxidoreductase YuxK